MTAARPDAAARVAPYYYSAFGLTVVSDFELAELTPADPAGSPPQAGRTLRIVDGPIEDARWRESDNVFFDLAADRPILAWKAVGAFRIGDDGTILVQPAEGVDLRLVAFPLLGPVMALLLHRRGRLVLHASAVEINGRAVVLLGDKGAGKSTTAGALVAAGHRLLTDDLVIVSPDPQTGGPMVEPAAAQLKLWHEARSALDLADSEMIDADLHPSILKRQHRLRSGFSTQAAPLGMVLALERSDRLRIVALDAGGALTTLIRFSYVVRFGQEALRGDASQRHFVQCADVANAAFVGRLGVPDDLDRLGEVASLLERQMKDPQPFEDAS